MRVIGVTQRVDTIASREETRDAIDQKISKMVLRLGFLPVPIPNVLGPYTKEWIRHVKPCGFLLTGGNNLGESQSRDDTEISILDIASEERLPVLGICRGMQLMGKWGGVALHRVAAHVKVRHVLSGDICWNVNSFHEYALESCPIGFKVIARSEDMEIEAIRHMALPWEGWMWHPEREPQLDSFVLDRIQSLFL